MQDAASDDKMAAQSIRDAIATLNRAIKAAADAGLSVEIETMGIMQIGSPQRYVTVMARIERRESL